jgi:hypothetical protein
MPLSEHHAVKVVHRLPHRTRIRMPKIHRTPGKMEKMGDRLKEIEGVKGVTVDHRTGSILLDHHDDPGFIEGLMSSLEEAGDLFLSVMMEEDCPEEMSVVSKFLKETLGSANSNISHSTRGFLDLRMIVPLGFLGAALWKMRTTKGWLIEVPPYVLLWYAFDSYMKLHHHDKPSDDATGIVVDGE